MGIGILWVTMKFFFVKGGKIRDFIHTQKKRSPHQHGIPNDDVGLLVAKSRESAPGPYFNVRQGTPYGYRHMNGYGSHTYLLDDANQHTLNKIFQNGAGNQ
jgi:catalase